MNGGHTSRPPEKWSYAAAPDALRPWRVNRGKILLAIVGVLVAATGLLTWLALPRGVAPGPASMSYQRKPSLVDKPPTLIVNALQVRSLYPPGYTDYKPKPLDDHQSPYVGAKRDVTSDPPGCEHDPAVSDSSVFTSAMYRVWPLLYIMYRVDDPSGDRSGNDDGIYLSIYPTKDGSGQIDKWRQWYRKCGSAQMAVLVSKDGNILKEETYARDHVIIDTPRTPADDSLGVTDKEETRYTYYGSIRGMIVSLKFPPTQKDTCAALFRTVMLRIQEI
jgi:hypothetical protein